MPRAQDDFSSVSTARLRGLAVVVFPGKRSSRLSRPALVDLFIASMIADELEAFNKAARRRLASCESVDHLRTTVHRQMYDRYGSVLTSYLSSPRRLSDPAIAALNLQAAPPLPEQERGSQTPVSRHPASSAPASTQQVEDSQPGEHTSQQMDAFGRQVDVEDEQDAIEAAQERWPQPISPGIQRACMSRFRDATNIAVASTCAICARRTFTQDLLFTSKHLACSRLKASSIDLDLLKPTDPHIIARTQHFRYGHSLLDDLVLAKDGVHITDGIAELDICNECLLPLRRPIPALPALALANGTFRGVLPAHLQDCTWVEERLCARYLGSAYVVRLYDLTTPGAPETRQRVMKGHACSFPLNTLSTAAALPWALSRNGALISCVVVGPRKPRQEDLRKVFKVRKRKVFELFHFLRANFKDYPQFPLDNDALNELPDDGVPDAIYEQMVFSAREQVNKLFEQETAGLEQHPGLLGDRDNEAGEEQDTTFVEHHGLVDIDGTTVTAGARAASALTNATGNAHPDFIIRNGSTFVESYNNPSLFPGMFPTLYPWGTGGFEGLTPTKLAFDTHANYLLDLADPCFRRHWSFIFFVANTKQRREINHGTRLACKRPDHERFSKILAGLPPPLVQQVARHLAQGGSLSTLGPEESRIFSLLKKCELVTAHVPGSKAIMTRARSNIRAYIGEFGIFQLFVTINPSPTHSPVFHIFYGDESVNLDLPAPTLPSATNRAIRVADDPVAASDYFHFHVNAAFQFLLGWDVRKGRSTEEGGLFGRLQAFFMVKEHTMRGQLHCHALIWLEGGINPGELRKKMAISDEFRDRYLKFFDDLILHHAPPVPAEECAPSDQSAQRFPRQERPPDPNDPDFEARFASDQALLAEAVQRHRCTFTCFKGGRSSCRFLFPHDINPAPFFDAATRSIHPRVLDASMNWYNAWFLVALRHNVDVKAVQSGLSGIAAASYMTNYATKFDETPANQISMIHTVYERMLAAGKDTSQAYALLSRCAMQFARERQLHAQQAAMYVRELGDTQSSHSTVPMLSGRLLRTVLSLYGPAREDAADQDDAKGADDAILSPGPASSETGTRAAATAPNDTRSPAPEVRVLIPHHTPGHSEEDTSAEVEDEHLTSKTGAAEDTNAMNGTTSSTSEVPAIASHDASGQAEHNMSERAEDEDLDHGLLPLNGRQEAHQVDDYLYRGKTLSHLCFYDFVRCVKLVPRPKNPNKNHHALHAKHPNAAKLYHRYTPTQPVGIPRAYFSTFPRSNGTSTHGDLYCAAMMAHFGPFSAEIPLKGPQETWEDAFARLTISKSSTRFSARSNRIMSNWAALTECDDARDALQLQRRKREAVRTMNTQLFPGNDEVGHDNPLADVEMEHFLDTQTTHSLDTTAFLAALNHSGWFDMRMGPPMTSSPTHAEDGTAHVTVLSTTQDCTDPTQATFTRERRRKWQQEQDVLEAQARANLAAPKASCGILAEQLSFEPVTAAQATTTAEDVSFEHPSSSIPALATLHNPGRSRSPHDLINALVKERGLTASQRLAFTIAARKFFEELHGCATTPLRMLMHGEAGTGKTVVVRLLREVMDRFGRGKEIKLVAPTGKAASAIGGLTQHSAFGIEVHRRGVTTEELSTTQSPGFARRVRFLRDSFAGVRWLFFDEVSMTSCEALAAIDKALRMGTERHEEPFGGINVLFAGDLCQLPPVAAAALYYRSSKTSQATAARTTVGLGRGAWLHIDEVVEFTEQKRMKDADMAAALSRLRIRQCTQADANLFNANVLRSDKNPQGVDVKGQRDLIVLARTNETVRTLNQKKASVQATTIGQSLEVSHAIDKSGTSMSADLRELLLSYHGSGNTKTAAGRVPLFIGMPVIYRGSNQSTALGVTNGAFGTIVGWQLTRDRWGLSIPVGAVVQLHPEADWSLTDLPKGSVPIYPSTSKFSFTDRSDVPIVHNISRKQLPLQPGFAMTVHSAQGITSKGGVVVDLRRGGFEAYVAASRATNRRSLYLLDTVTVDQLNTPKLPKDLDVELDRLIQLAERTRHRHDHDNWRIAPKRDGDALLSSHSPKRQRLGSYSGD